ncbi:SDR family NAD(P)-dependent oxidoreductase [Actinomadura formosensis]|uniref:SDR family NAD(P)-dependent oxidoreductase n=1 Tax=Actinomadura formosensis TaxID=60706 RepID=UPI003D8D084C
MPRVVELDPLPVPPESGTAFTGLRFLIVDDGCGIALELGDLLERHGAQVRTPPDVDGPCDGLVHLAALRPGAASVLPPAFGAIRQALAGGLRWLVLASGAGGTFGHRFDGGVGDPAPGAGLRGLARTIAREHPEVLVRALDVDTKDTPRALAQRIMAELLTADAPVVIGHEGGLRYGLELVPSGPPGGAPLNLARDAVVLLTGGERGMTARLALELARTSGCHIELMGRTPEREIRVDALLEHAASVRYHAGDVRDPRAVRDVVENIYLTHRRLDGMIHGAALAEPRPGGGTTPGSFEDVYLTKVAGACALAQAAGSDLGFFAVLSGADGERGGAGAAAANDACGTLAHVWRRRLRGRVLVAETLLGPDAGAPALLREITHGDEPHVVLTGEVR